MFRAYVLLFFTYFFFHLKVSGNITKYINMKYAFLSDITIYLLAFLTIVQFYLVATEEKNAHIDCDCDHDHIHEKNLPFYKRWGIYAIFLFPLLTGFFLPIATLDSNIVKAKGFSFKAIDTTDEYAQIQYLRPDSSVYYGTDGYEELMQKELKQYLSKKSIVLNDKNYLKGMETIYNYPGDFLGKNISFDGFSFKGDSENSRQLFVLRFGVIHCVADSGVFGMLVEFPDDVNLKDDDWIHVEGTLSSMYYQPFKSTIPVLKIRNWKTIHAPDDPYVYRGIN